MDETRKARKASAPSAAANILPETRQELNALESSHASAHLPERQPGDVQDGSVEYFDFDWGQPVRVSEGTIFSGCRRGDTSYTDCTEMPPCRGEDPDTPVDPDDPCPDENDPGQGDDPGYETVEP